VLGLKACATTAQLFIYLFYGRTVVLENQKKKKDLFYVCEYTVAVFRHTRRGHCIPLQMVVSHHVVAGN
jgi:hypothetical protein